MGSGINNKTNEVLCKNVKKRRNMRLEKYYDRMNIATAFLSFRSISNVAAKKFFLEIRHSSKPVLSQKV